MTIATLIHSDPAKRRSFNWRVFLVLLGVGTLGLVASLPYVVSTGMQQGAELAPRLLAVQTLAQVGLLAVQIGIGLLVGCRIGLGAPMLTRWLGGKRVRSWKRVLLNAALIGAAGGALVLALDLFVFAPLLEAEFQVMGVSLPQNPNPPAWQGLLAALYGGITEEITMRLFLLTLLAWLGSKLSHTADGRPTKAVLWTATIIAGLGFGLGHLPAAMAMGIPLTPLLVGRTILLNLSSILFGWLYWKRGLESAMAAHFSLDIVLHVVGAFLMGM